VQPECGAAAWGQDLWLTGSQYENAASLHCIEYSLPSVIGVASPIYAFAVTDVIGSKVACSLGPLTNYVTFEVSSTSCNGNTHLAHEMGSRLQPAAHGRQNEPMFKNCIVPGRENLSGFQKAIVRGSKYVSYL
jgi:hypothetical protein